MTQDSPQVFQSNSLTEARYSLTLQEQRLLLLFFSKINRETDSLEFVISVSEFNSIIELNTKNSHERLRDICVRLGSRVLNINQGQRWLILHWFDYAEYVDGVITIGINKKLKQHLLHLGDHFTNFSLKEIVKFNSMYSIRIYMLIKQYKNTKHKYRIIKTEQLKELLEIKDKYSLFTEFRRNVIDKAITEINENPDCDIKVYYELIKHNKTVVEIKFIFENKFENEKIKEELLILLDVGLSKSKLIELQKKYSVEELLKALERLKQAKGVKSKPAYLMKIIANESWKEPLPPDTELETIDKPMTKQEAQKAASQIMGNAKSSEPKTLNMHPMFKALEEVSQKDAEEELQSLKKMAQFFSKENQNEVYEFIWKTAQAQYKEAFKKYELIPSYVYS